MLSNENETDALFGSKCVMCKIENLTYERWWNVKTVIFRAHLFYDWIKYRINNILISYFKLNEHIQ